MKLIPLLALPVLLALPASALTITVTTAIDELHTPSGANISLREAIRDASSGDTIDFDASLDGTPLVLTMGEFNLSKDVTIDASGLTENLIIHGNNNSGIFKVTSGTIDLKSLTLTQGRSFTDGGGIHLSGGASLTLTDCKVRNCRTESIGSFGGAIYCDSSTLTLVNTSLENNTSVLESGGAIFSTGAGASINLTGCHLRGNTAAKQGGGIRSNGSGTVTLTDSSFLYNSGSFGGGLSQSTGTATITACTFAYNSATTAGGGVYLANLTATIKSSTSVKNSAADGGGGWALNAGATATLESTTTYGNKARNNGGGIIVRSSTLTLKNSIVSQNTGGGSSDVHYGSGTISSVGTNLIGSNHGADIPFPTGNPNVNGDIVGTNAAPIDAHLSSLGYFGGPTMSMHPLAGSPALQAGGATTLLTDQRGYTRVVSSLLDIGAVEAGPVKVVTTSDDENDGALGLGNGDSLRECIEDISSPGSRIVFSASVNGSTITLLHGLLDTAGKNFFIDASAMSNGITIDADNLSSFFVVWNGDNLALESLVLTNGRNAFTVGLAAYGGAISFVNGATGHMSNCTFDQCSTVGAKSGGALFIDRSSASIRDCNFTSNTSASGGALSMSDSRLQMSHCSFSDNLATSSGTPAGGALFSYMSTFDISQCSFIDNTASGSLGGIGGAIYSSNAPNIGLMNVAPTSSGIANSTFHGNQAIQGGGITIYGTQGKLLLQHLTITGNAADAGGGMYIRRSGLGSDALTLDHCIIAANLAPFYADIQYELIGGDLSQFLTPGPNLIGNNQSIETIFPAGVLTGTQATPLDAMLGTLGNHGGPTQTIYLLSGSPAIDSGSLLDSTPATDQRGFDRVIGTAPDLGAYENGNAFNYTTWTLEHIPSGGDTAFSGNHEGDPNINGIEYGTGRNPSINEPADIISSTRVEKAGGGYEMHLTFNYEPNASDITYVLGRNSDLGTFDLRYTFNPSSGIELFAPGGLVTSTINPTNKTITIIDDDIGSEDKYFWQLQIGLLP